MNFYILCAVLFVGTAAQQYTTPVPILKQINRYNEDGSYSYGYEAADGTYKIESKYPNGEVYGKYGYIDDQGKLREIEYGASRRGFEPAGNEVNVAPPTLTNNYPKPLGPNEEDDGQYREDPSIYYKNDPNNAESSQQSYSQPSRFASQSSYAPQSSQEPAYQPQSYQQPSYQQPSYQQPSYQQPSFRPQTSFNSYSQPRYNPAPPAYPNYNQFNGHPASNIDITSGSYTVQYKKR